MQQDTQQADELELGLGLANGVLQLIKCNKQAGSRTRQDMAEHGRDRKRWRIYSKKALKIKYSCRHLKDLLFIFIII